MRIDVVIPALNEEQTIAAVIEGLPRPPVHTVWVADNGSTDRTAARARAAGARVVPAPRRGYGSACSAALEQLPAEVEVVVFVDGDGSDRPSDLLALVAPILDGRADLVVGTRVCAEKGALTFPQRFGNALASCWLRARFGLPATDLGPFRAIRRDVLTRLGMESADYGWTVEMQIKVAKLRLRYQEVPVAYRRRAGGHSKISGTLRGVWGAGSKIIELLLRHDLAGGP